MVDEAERPRQPETARVQIAETCSVEGIGVLEDEQLERYHRRGAIVGGVPAAELRELRHIEIGCGIRADPIEIGEHPVGRSPGVPGVPAVVEATDVVARGGPSQFLEG